MDPAALAALRRKYEVMLTLRLAHEAGDPADPRRAMAALASEFPGALREIDVLPMGEIRARIDALAVAEAGGAKPPWMRAVHEFHAGTRGALCAKKWLAGKKTIDATTREAFVRDAAALCWGPDALEWADDLARVASPPRGRVTDLVFERIAASLGSTIEEARALIFATYERS